MSEVSVINQAEEPAGLDLPPGFRFHPTDEEIVSHYLTPKALDRRFSTAVVGEVDLNKCEPWDLPGKAKMGEKEWWFFCHKDRKYPTGMRTNRATESGYWKATGKDKEIFRGRGVLVGMKKTLVFYLGRAPRGEKTGWVMHEFRLDGKLPHLLSRAAKEEWAVCRVFNKDFAARDGPMAPGAAATAGLERTNSFAFIDGFLSSAELPPLMDPPFGADVAEVIDFKGAATGAQAVPGATYQVKMEQPVQQQQQQLLYASPYFSLPAVATGDMPPAIRRYCKEEQLSGQTTSTDRHTAAGAEISSAVTSAQQFLGIDDLSTDPSMDLAAEFWETEGYEAYTGLGFRCSIN